MTRRHRWRTILNVVGDRETLMTRSRLRLWISILTDGADVGISRALIAYSWTITFFD